MATTYPVRGDVFPGNEPARPISGERPLRAFWDDERTLVLERYGALTARFLLGAIFLVSGIAKVADPKGTSAYIKAAGLPMVPVLLALAAIIEIGGGLSLMAGFKARVGALIVFLYMIPVTLAFHAFWAVPDEQAKMQMVNFMKNLSIMGGLMMVVSFGSGFCSLDALLKKKRGLPL